MPNMFRLSPTGLCAGLLCGGILASWMSAVTNNPEPVDLLTPVSQPAASGDSVTQAREIRHLLDRAVNDRYRQYRYDTEQQRVLAEPRSRLLIPVQGVKPGQLFNSFRHGRSDGRIHRAIDIMAPEGRPVIAADDGIIERLHDSDDGGLAIYQTDPSGSFLFYYAHLDDYASGIRAGMRIKRGTVIGYVGSTGNAKSDAPHLHFAIYRRDKNSPRWTGTPINPYPLLTSQ